MEFPWLSPWKFGDARREGQAGSCASWRVQQDHGEREGERSRSGEGQGRPQGERERRGEQRAAPRSPRAMERKREKGSVHGATDQEEEQQL